MSFLSELQTRKNILKPTETVVTTPSGLRYVEDKLEVELPPTYGFIVDTKPDKVPALITKHLYIGSQDCTADDVLKSYNIKRVLSLGIEVEVSVRQKFVECLDLPETDIKPMLLESLPYIRAGVELVENVLVHCNAGVSRAATVGIAYLMQYQGMGFDAAYSYVKEKRPAIQPNDGFKKQFSRMKPGALI